MPYIKWIAEQEATGEVKSIYDEWLAANPHRDRMPDILKCFSLRPDVLKPLLALCYPLHFSDGYLTRRQKEMIATHVSALNKCPY